jgi:hypothetical protein
VNPLQVKADSTKIQSNRGEARRVDGKVVRGTRKGPVPVGNQRVILHRLGRERAGPLDSMRTTADGRYSMRYRTSGDTSALYFVSASYDGVAYLGSLLRAPLISGDDAQITVFDTTSVRTPIRVGARHLIVGAPNANGRRPIGEVFDLQNDSTVTVVSPDSAHPVWTGHIPASAVGFNANPDGDSPNGAPVRHGNEVGAFAAVSPGIRQVAFTYELPANAFPLTVQMETPTGVLELLVQEPNANVQGPDLRERAPVSTEGRIFRRFLAQDLAGTAVVHIDVPRIIGRERERVYVGVAVALIAAMAAALVTAALRSSPRGSAPAHPHPGTRSKLLLHGIATLDSEFERGGAADVAARDAYDVRRAALKEELMAELVEERRRS